MMSLIKKHGMSFLLFIGMLLTIAVLLDFVESWNYIESRHITVAKRNAFMGYALMTAFIEFFISSNTQKLRLFILLNAITGASFLFNASSESITWIGFFLILGTLTFSVFTGKKEKDV